MADTNIEEGMTYVEKLGFRDQQHRFEMEKIKAQEAEATKRAKYNLREARQETYQVIGAGILIAAVLLGIIFAIYKGTRPGPHSDDPAPVTVEERREQSCMAEGGTWVPASVIVGSQGMCVMPGTSPKKEDVQ